MPTCPRCAHTVSLPCSIPYTIRDLAMQAHQHHERQNKGGRKIDGWGDHDHCKPGVVDNKWKGEWCFKGVLVDDKWMRRGELGTKVCWWMYAVLEGRASGERRGALRVCWWTTREGGRGDSRVCWWTAREGGRGASRVCWWTSGGDVASLVQGCVGGQHK